MPDWLDRWTNTRRLSQQELAKRWALRGQPEADDPPVIETPTVLPIEHSRYILTNGKKAYRRWVDGGCPDKEAAIVCPVMTAVAEFFHRKRCGTWKARQPVHNTDLCNSS